MTEVAAVLRVVGKLLEDLDVVLTRVRPSGIDVLATMAIRQFRQRPAAEWGAEYASFLRQNGASHFSATLVLPRHEVIARLILLRGSQRATLGLLRELPLRVWREVPGTKLRISDFVRAPWQLAQIHFELQRGLRAKLASTKPVLPPTAEFEGSGDS